MSKHAIIGIVLSLVAAGGTPAFAQSQPFQGVFGAQFAPAPPRSLDLSTSLFGVYDTNLPRVALDGDKPDVYFTDLHSSLWYTRRGERTTFSANGASAVQHYPELDDAVRWSGTGAVALNRTTRRGTFGIDQQVRYSPYAHFRVIPVSDGTTDAPADVAAPDAALRVSGRESYRYNTGLNAGFQLRPRLTLNATYDHEYLDFVPVGEYDWRTHDASISLNHSVTSKTTFVVGYGYHQRDFQGERVPLHRHDINIGVNYNNALPFSPRTMFRFGVGTTALTRDRVTTSTSDISIMRAIGNANLEHQVSRTWHVGVFYARAVQYVEGVSDVFLADSVTANIRGFLGPRVELRATTGYSTAPLRYGPTQRAYDTSASTARVRMGLTRSLAAQAEYVHYRYLFSDDVTLPTGTPGRTNRHVFRVGLTTWLPLLN